MSALVSKRVEAGLCDRLPPGAVEAEFAFHMAKAIRAGLDVPVTYIDDFPPPAPRACGVQSTAMQAVDHPCAGEAVILHEGKWFVSRRLASEMLQVSPQALFNIGVRRSDVESIIVNTARPGGPVVYFSREAIERVRDRRAKSRQA